MNDVTFIKVEIYFRFRLHSEKNYLFDVWEIGFMYLFCFSVMSTRRGKMNIYFSSVYTLSGMVLNRIQLFDSFYWKSGKNN